MAVVARWFRGTKYVINIDNLTFSGQTANTNNNLRAPVLSYWNIRIWTIWLDWNKSVQYSEWNYPEILISTKFKIDHTLFLFKRFCFRFLYISKIHLISKKLDVLLLFLLANSERDRENGYFFKEGKKILQSLFSILHLLTEENCSQKREFPYLALYFKICSQPLATVTRTISNILPVRGATSCVLMWVCCALLCFLRNYVGNWTLVANEW